MTRPWSSSSSHLAGQFAIPSTWLGRFSTAQTSQRRPYSVTQVESTDPAATRQVVDLDDEDPAGRRMRLEAVLLLAKSSLTTRKLAQLAHLADATEARTLVRQLNQIYDDYGRSLKIEQVAGGYRMLTRAAVAPWLTRLGHLPPAVRLSSPMMETLAVVAYRQPVSRANVESVRGVACGELLRQLMERDLIRIAGRSEELGRPYLYGTTKRFLQLFGLPSTDALPPIQWQRLQEDPPEELSLDDLSTPTKESVVSTVLASVVSDTDPEVQLPVTVLESDSIADARSVTAEIEDEEIEDEDDDEEDDDWDEEDDDDDDWADDDDDDDLDEDDDDDDLDEDEDDDDLDEDEDDDDLDEDEDDDDLDEDEDDDDDLDEDDEGDEWVEVDDGDEDIDDDEDEDEFEDDDEEWDKEEEEKDDGKAAAADEEEEDEEDDKAADGKAADDDDDEEDDDEDWEE